MKNFNFRKKYHKFILGGLALFIFQAKVDAKVFTGDNFKITYPPLWDTLLNKNIIAKNSGLSGISILTNVPGSRSPNLDSITLALGDSLGGHFTKAKNGVLTLGKYTVNWQDFAYDSLPKLSAQIQISTGLPLSIKNDSIRVYYLVSDGYVFTLSGMTIKTGFINPVKPYADLESAIATLILGPQTSMIREISGRWGGAEKWVRDGRLGGAWFSAHRPRSIDCFNLRGAWVGAAIRTNSEGIWVLPSIDRNSLLLITLADGSRLHLPIRN